MIGIIVNPALAFYKFRAGKSTGSTMLNSDAKIMRSDIISIAVLAGLLFTFALELPVVDALTALGVSVWITWVAFGIFLETNVELMERYGDPSTYQEIFDIHTKPIGNVEGPKRYGVSQRALDDRLT
ncbi:MAG: cation transporter [Spirochaetota bacterium]